MKFLFFLYILSIYFMSLSLSAHTKTIRIATLNASMDATNYVVHNQMPVGDELQRNLDSGEHQQIKNIAEIIQRTRPDIILLNEFDYSKQSALLLSR